MAYGSRACWSVRAPRAWSATCCTRTRFRCWQCASLNAEPCVTFSFRRCSRRQTFAQRCTRRVSLSSRPTARPKMKFTKCCYSQGRGRNALVSRAARSRRRESGLSFRAALLAGRGYDEWNGANLKALPRAATEAHARRRQWRGSRERPWRFDFDFGRAHVARGRLAPGHATQRLPRAEIKKFRHHGARSACALGRGVHARAVGKPIGVSIAWPRHGH